MIAANKKNLLDFHPAVACIFFLAMLFLPACSQLQGRDLYIEKKTATHASYTFFTPQNSSASLTLTRPTKDDPNILAVVAGTYTSPQNTVEGFVILDGKIIQNKERQGWNGAAIFKNGTVEILQTNNGTLLTREKMQEVADADASLIQAHLLVYKGQAEQFKPQKLYIRRALALVGPAGQGQSADAFDVSNTGPIIIESRTAIDLNEFARDLVKLGITDAINLDMGSWSEGWYRTSKDGSPVTIGLPSAETKHQTNWIYFSASSSAR